MGFQIPVGIQEPFEKLPTGFIVFNIDGCEDGMMGFKEDDLVFGIQVSLTAEEPTDVSGITRQEKFYLGIRESDSRVKSNKMKADRECQLPETLLKTLSRFKAFAMAAGVDIEGKDSEVVYSELKNRKILGKVIHVVGTEDPTKTYAQIDRWMPVGSGVEPHVTEEAAQAPRTGKPAPAQAGPKPAAPPSAGAPPAAAAAGQAPVRALPKRLGR